MLQINVRGEKRARTVFGILAAHGVNWHPGHQNHEPLLGHRLTNALLTSAGMGPITIYVEGDTVYNSTSNAPVRVITAHNNMNKLSRILEEGVAKTIRLTGEYQAILDRGVVQVGCQTIPNSKVLEVADAIRNQ